MSAISYDDFRKVEMHTGTVVSVEDFPEARKPAYKLVIDFGPSIGRKRSSAQITDLYRKEELTGRTVVCVTHFPPKQIGPFLSEVLTLGVQNPQGHVALLGVTGKDIVPGSRIF